MVIITNSYDIVKDQQHTSGPGQRPGRPGRQRLGTPPGGPRSRSTPHSVGLTAHIELVSALAVPTLACMTTHVRVLLAMAARQSALGMSTGAACASLCLS